LERYGRSLLALTALPACDVKSHDHEFASRGD
jgi:hypothetical protein